jgi:hypothetical protein
MKIPLDAGTSQVVNEYVKVKSKQPFKKILGSPQ